MQKNYLTDTHLFKTKESGMHAMVLAAGLAIRLQPLTEVKSKSMVNIVGEPILEHTGGTSF